MATPTKVAKTQRSRRALESRAPKVHENPKTLLALKGPKSSQLITTLLKDLHKFKTPHSKHLVKRNLTRPIEDASSVEFLGQVNDASLFAYGSHSKKRPHNLVLGRLFDYQLLDLFEFGIDEKTFLSMDEFAARRAIVRVGSKPSIVFQGELWDANEQYVMLKNFMLDFFHGEHMEKINLAAVDRAIVLTATDKAIHFRHYGLLLKQQGEHTGKGNLPRVELEEVGPRMDLTLRRHKPASDDLLKESLRQPKVAGPKSIFQKNIERSRLGEKVGRVHMQKQDLANLNVARLKGLKKRKRNDEGGDDSMSDAPASSSSSRSLVGDSTNTMDEFSSRGSSSTTGRASTKDRTLSKQKAGGYGTKPIEGGYKDVQRKKKKLDA